MIPLVPMGSDAKLVGQSCADLHVRTDQLEDGSPCLLTVWEPTPAETKRLQQGAKVHLWILGTTTPPVMLSVGDVPDINAG